MTKNSKRRPTLAQWEDAAEAAEIEDPDQLVATVDALKDAVVTPPVIITITIDRSTGRMEIASNVQKGPAGLEDLEKMVIGLKKIAENIEAQAKEIEVEIRVAERLQAEMRDQEAEASSQEE